MLMPEAVQLILQASAHLDLPSVGHGRIFVLEMGDQMRIVDLAEQMVRLAGLEPGRDVKIEFVGLRPGEKLYEELFDDSEQILSTGIPGIMVAAAPTLDRQRLDELITELEELLARTDDPAQITRLLEAIVPGFRRASWGGGPQVGAAARGSMQKAKDPKQQNDRQRDSDQPKKTALQHRFSPL